jgi:methionyl aminopeptidase
MTEQQARPGRNEPCWCGSGRKYKHCCLAKDEAEASAARAQAAADAPAAPPEAVPATPTRPPKPQTHQPWKTRTTRGFVPRTRTPRKVGGS